MIQDLINGIFELSGSLFILLSIIKLYKSKIVRGVSYIHIGYFSAWGFWNIYYYPYLKQWISFIGGIGIIITNTTYLILLIYYTIKEKQNDKKNKKMVM